MNDEIDRLRIRREIEWGLAQLRHPRTRKRRVCSFIPVVVGALAGAALAGLLR